MKMSRFFSSTLLLVAAVVVARPAAAVSVPSEVIATGNGWRLVDVEPATRANSMVWEVTRAGVANLPVSQAQKDILTQAWADLPPALNNDANPDTLFFSQELLDAMVTPTWPAGYEQFIEPETETRGFSVCSWSTKTKGGSWSHSENSLSVDLPFSGSVTGELTANLPMSVQASVSVTYKVRKCLGIPVAFRFEYADASGSANIQGSGDISLTANWADEWSKEWLVTTVELGQSTFFVGPIPVRLVYTLPIYTGARFGIDITGQISVALDASASGSFNYHCTKSSCSGTSSFSDQFDFHDPTASVTVKMEAEASARVMFRVAVYDESILYVEGGAKAYAKAKLWGYYGNTCGDADGNGQNETVRALVADVLWGYKFAYGWGGWIEPDVRYFGGSEYWLAWYDLLGTGGSTALAPMITGPGSVGEGEDGSYSVRMRPCYPYTEPVTLAMAPGVWNGTTTVTPPSGATTLSHTFPTSGTTTITATAVSDSRGRQLAASYGRPITVAVGLPAAPSYLTATALSATSVRLNWTDNSHNEDQFEIQRRPTQVGAFQQVGLVGTNVTTFTDNTVAAGTTYDYRVKAVNSAGTSNPSGVSVVTTPAYPVPAAPSNLVASYNPTTQKITATWADNANNETGFTLEFSYSGSPWTPVSGTLGVNATSWQSGAGVLLGSYQFRVRANNANGSSAWSNVASLLAIP
jgi:Fibronectin type III domain